MCPKGFQHAGITTLPNQMSCKIYNVPMIYRQTPAGMRIRNSHDLKWNVCQWRYSIGRASRRSQPLFDDASQRVVNHRTSVLGQQSEPWQPIRTRRNWKRTTGQNEFESDWVWGNRWEDSSQQVTGLMLLMAAQRGEKQLSAAELLGSSLCPQLRFRLLIQIHSYWDEKQLFFVGAHRRYCSTNTPHQKFDMETHLSSSVF